MPDLPELMRVHDDDGSVLAKKYGPGVTNYYSGAPLNRLSFLREDYDFLSRAFSSPDTQFVALNDFAPLVRDKANLRPIRLEDFVSVSGSDPFKRPEKDLVAAYDSKVTTPLIVFLGIREDEVSEFKVREFQGCPWFAVDLTPKGSYADEARKVIEKITSSGCTFLKTARQNTLSSEFGKCQHNHSLALSLTRHYSFYIRTGQGHNRLEHPQPVLRRVRPPHAFCPRRL